MRLIRILHIINHKPIKIKYLIDLKDPSNMEGLFIYL